VRIGGGGVDFFIGMRDVELVVVFQDGKQRGSVQPGANQATELISRQVARFDCERFASAEPEPL